MGATFVPARELMAKALAALVLAAPEHGLAWNRTDGTLVTGSRLKQALLKARTGSPSNRNSASLPR